MYKFLLIISIIIFSNSLTALTIKETIKSTIENNPKIRIGLEKINESKELIAKSSGELLPDISSTISGTFETSEQKKSTGTTNNDTFSDKYKLTISQNLYDAGFNNKEIERSNILLDNEILNFKILLENLIMDAITGYLTVINYETSLISTKKSFETVSKILEETKTRYDNGAATIYDLQFAESSYANAESKLYSAQQNLKIGKKSFKRISGIDAINLDKIVQINHNLDLEIIENNTIEKNHSLKLIKNDILNKQILLLKEKKTKKPNLDLTGTAEYSDSDRIDTGTETLKGNVSITLTIPIFQQGIDDSNIRKYVSQISQAELTLDDTKDDLLLNLSNSYKDFKINEYNMKAKLASIKASETLIKIINEEYIIGTKSIGDLLQEEEVLLNTKLDYSNSKKEYLISYFKIKSIEGSLLEDFKEYLPNLN